MDNEDSCAYNYFSFLLKKETIAFYWIFFLPNRYLSWILQPISRETTMRLFYISPDLDLVNLRLISYRDSIVLTFQPNRISWMIHRLCIRFVVKTRELFSTEKCHCLKLRTSAQRISLRHFSFNFYLTDLVSFLVLNSLQLAMYFSAICYTHTHTVPF